MSGDSEQPDDLYWSERTKGVPVADQETISFGFWRGFVVEMRERHFDKNYGTGWGNLPDQLVGEVGINWPTDADVVPETAVALDCVEFFARRRLRDVRERRVKHPEDAAQAYVTHVNLLFRRNRHPYRLDDKGRVQRSLGAPLAAALVDLDTGDIETDRLLEEAEEKFCSANPQERQIALEKLWDAFERLKTHGEGDKRASATSIIAGAVPEGPLRDAITAEFDVLTKFGNRFRIRHHEKDRVLIERPVDVEWAFHRLYALVRFCVLGRREATT